MPAIHDSRAKSAKDTRDGPLPPQGTPANNPDYAANHSSERIAKSRQKYNYPQPDGSVKEELDPQMYPGNNAEPMPSTRPTHPYAQQPGLSQQQVLYYRATQAPNHEHSTRLPQHHDNGMESSQQNQIYYEDTYQQGHHGHPQGSFPSQYQQPTRQSPYSPNPGPGTPPLTGQFVIPGQQAFVQGMHNPSYFSADRPAPPRENNNEGSGVTFVSHVPSGAYQQASNKRQLPGLPPNMSPALAQDSSFRNNTGSPKYNGDDDKMFRTPVYSGDDGGFANLSSQLNAVSPPLHQSVGPSLSNASYGPPSENNPGQLLSVSNGQELKRGTVQSTTKPIRFAQEYADPSNFRGITTLVNLNAVFDAPIVETTFVDPRTCTICGKKITRDMARHLRTHQEELRFVCVYYMKGKCSHKNGKFNRPYDFKKHLLNRHFNFDNATVKSFHNLLEKLRHEGMCNCGSRFMGGSWLDEHVLTKSTQDLCSLLRP